MSRKRGRRGAGHSPRSGNGLRQRAEAEAVTRNKAAPSPEHPDAPSPEATRAILHELRVHQIELEMQNEELQASSLALAAERARYLDLYELAPAGYVTVDESGLVRAANLTLATRLGVPRGTLLNRPFSKFILAEDTDRLHLARIRCKQTGEPQSCELRIVRSDGSPVWMHAAVTWRGPDQPEPEVRITLGDISELKEASAALQAREAQLRLLIERLPVLFWTTDAALGMTSWREGMGASSAVVKGTPLGGFFEVGGESPLVAAHTRALGGESASCIFSSRGVEYEVRVEPLRDDGSVGGTVGVALDTTLRRRLESREREAREVTTLGQVAGGVAHGVNNALATIVGIASVMLGDPVTTDEMRINLEAIRAAGGRAHRLAADLLGFARQGSYRPVRIDLNALASDAADWTRKHGRRLEVSLAPDTPAVEADPDQLRDAVLNVCQNAVDATPPDATIRITTRREWVEAAHEGRRSGAEPHACLVVRDEGVGMSEEVRLRATEPFFTTKEGGEGAGLGLSMAFGVVRRSGGDLHVASKPRGGTAVTLCLPAAALAPPGTPGPAPPLSATREPGERSVLVVDDDEHVQFSSRKILQSLGYTVTEALDGPTALRLYQQAPRRFAVVLLDLRMPGMDGEEVLRRLLAIDPEVRVIICTGFERDQVSKRIFATGRVGFLGKPFGPKDVLEQIKFVHAELV